MKDFAKVALLIVGVFVCMAILFLVSSFVNPWILSLLGIIISAAIIIWFIQSRRK